MKKAAATDEKVISELKPWPNCIQQVLSQDRILLWDELKAKYKLSLASKPVNDITITLREGKEVVAQSWRTTPYEIARNISQGLADSVVIAKVNDVLWDLDRPLESDCKLELLIFEHPDGQQVFWHSSAHVLAEAMERVYGGCLCYGPPTENGFYYDMFCKKEISSSDFPFLESLCMNIINEKQPFERLELAKEDLLEMFMHNKFKIRFIREKIDTPTTTVYRCGSLIDLCRGPHIRHTGIVKAFKITKNFCSYWEGKANAKSLQRLYGISFPDTRKLKNWEHFQKEAAKRDHRKIGREQELFSFPVYFPGSCFLEPRGYYIYDNLVEFIRSEHEKQGFKEVNALDTIDSKFLETPDHWVHCSKNVFSVHCKIFDICNRSWRELPMRLADFGVLHSNELFDSLTGSTTVRRFQQDDAHIFCSIEQIKDEILGALDFLRHVYSVFGFTYNLCLSTRPEEYMGELEMWDQAEEALRESLNEFGGPWKMNSKDGAFYGPKIDITIKHLLIRAHQCTTIQLDFQSPILFNLSYINKAGEKVRPVIIHRAILGSVERMIAILTETYAGKWPFWLSPLQAVIIPIKSNFDDYAAQVKDRLRKAGFRAELATDPSDTLDKKIRNAELAEFNFILVVGPEEFKAGTVRVHPRNNVHARNIFIHKEVLVDDLIAKFKIFKERRDRNCEETFK